MKNRIPFTLGLTLSVFLLVQIQRKVVRTPAPDPPAAATPGPALILPVEVHQPPKAEPAKSAAKTAEVAAVATPAPSPTPEIDRTLSAYPRRVLDVTFGQLWILKTLEKPVYDIVAIGDSRTLVGVAPAIVEAGLPGRKMYNFAFPGGVLRGEYLDAVESLLDPSRPPGMIVVGISAKSVAGDRRKLGYIERALEMSELEKRVHLRSDKLLENVLPVSLEEAEDERHVQDRTLFEDGWVATRRHRTSRTFASYRHSLRGTPVSPGAVEGLLAKVRDWTARGRVVVGYFTPISPKMRSIEMGVGRLAREDLPRRFQEAGGAWLEFDEARYDYYDGHHMTPESAIDFSRDLGEALAATGTLSPGLAEAPLAAGEPSATDDQGGPSR